MIKKDLLQAAFKRLPKAKKHLNLKGMSDAVYYQGIERGGYSIRFSFILEETTGISALFWQAPDIYDEGGNRRFDSLPEVEI